MFTYLHKSGQSQWQKYIEYSLLALLGVANAVWEHELVPGTHHCTHSRSCIALVKLCVGVVDSGQARTRTHLHPFAVSHPQDGADRLTYLLLVSIGCQDLAILRILHEISPTAPQDGVLVLVGYSATFETEAGVHGDTERV